MIKKIMTEKINLEKAAQILMVTAVVITIQHYIYEIPLEAKVTAGVGLALYMLHLLRTEKYNKKRLLALVLLFIAICVGTAYFFN